MQIGTEFEMIEREKSGAQTRQIIDAIEEFSLSGGRQTASQLVRNLLANWYPKIRTEFYGETLELRCIYASVY